MIYALATGTLLICVVGRSAFDGPQELEPTGPPVAIAPAEIGEGVVGASKGSLVLIKLIQRELALTPVQRSRITDVLKEGQRAELKANERFQARFRLLGSRPDPTAYEALGRRFQQELDTLGFKTEADMLKVLDGRQRTRLDEIHLQAEGPVALSRPEVQRRLRLDPEQGRTIRALVARTVQRTSDDVDAVAASVRAPSGPYTPERSRAIYESKPYQDAMRKEGEIVRRARNDLLEAVTKLMTRDQHKQYLAMLGKPFDLARLRSQKPTR